ncbi:MAG: macro domain-containing protein [Nitrospinota bacterium]
MIRALVGDILESKAQTLVNTVNRVGVMGKGIALEFKKRFPDMYEDYVQRCKKGEVKLGRPYLFPRLTPPWILNFPTKDHWRSVAQLDDIVAGLEYLLEHYREWGITSLAVPPLGCGHGQLEWRVVGPTLSRYLSQLDIPVELYAPYDTPKEELESTFLAAPADIAGAGRSPARAPRLNPAWVALVEILARIEREPYHWPVGRTAFQKIAYFATESGLPTGLQHARGSFGPFAHELKALTTKLVNNGLIREERLGHMFSVKVGRTYEDALRTYEAQIQKWEPTIERITDLFLRMRTQEAEVAATVHFAARELAKREKRKPSEAEVLEEVKRWKLRRRPPLKENEVARAIRNLNLLDWLDLQPSPELPLPEDALPEV